MSTTVKVKQLHQCDLCKAEAQWLASTGTYPEQPIELAAYDGKTVGGPWAYMCHRHFETHGTGLGMGVGQKLVVAGDN